MEYPSFLGEHSLATDSVMPNALESYQYLTNAQLSEYEPALDALGAITPDTKLDTSGSTCAADEAVAVVGREPEQVDILDDGNREGDEEEQQECRKVEEGCEPAEDHCWLFT